MSLPIEEIYNAQVDKVYKFFYIHCFNQMTAEDLTSQTFMKFLEKLHDPAAIIQNNQKYLYGIMRNVWLEYLRRKYKEKEISVEQIDDFPAYVEESISTYEGQSLEARALPYIELLPEKQKVVIKMRLIEKRPLQEIALLLNKDMNYVKTTQKRGLKRLKELVKAAELSLVMRKSA